MGHSSPSSDRPVPVTLHGAVLSLAQGRRPSACDEMRNVLTPANSESVSKAGWDGLAAGDQLKLNAIDVARDLPDCPSDRLEIGAEGVHDSVSVLIAERGD